MPLTSDQITTIQREAILELPSSISGKEAKTLRAEIEEQMKDNPGMVMDIPFEWPSLEE